MDLILYIHYENLLEVMSMPLPDPGRKESQDDYVARCMRKFADDGSDLPRKNQLAACYNKYRQSKSKKKAKARVKRSRDLAQELRKLAEYYNSNYKSR